MYTHLTDHVQKRKLIVCFCLSLETAMQEMKVSFLSKVEFLKLFHKVPFKEIKELCPPQAKFLKKQTINKNTYKFLICPSSSTPEYQV